MAVLGDCVAKDKVLLGNLVAVCVDTSMGLDVVGALFGALVGEPVGCPVREEPDFCVGSREGVSVTGTIGRRTSGHNGRKRRWSGGLRFHGAIGWRCRRWDICELRRRQACWWKGW